MTRRFTQPRRWIRDFVAPLPLKRQLAELERHIYEAITSASVTLDELTGTNLGAGARVFRDKVFPYLRFRTIRGDDGVQVTENADGNHIDVVSTVVVANVGSGADVFRDKTGGDTHNLRGVRGINGITTVVNGDNVDVDGAALQLTFEAFDGTDVAVASQVVTHRRSRQRAFLEPDEDIVDQAGWGAVDEIDLYPQVDGLSFHSLTAPGADDTTEMVVRNRSEEISITIPHESTTSAAPLYRFACPQLQDYVLAPGESVKIKYASNSPARWWVTDRATASGITLEPRAGLGALGRFWRIKYGNDESPPSPGTEYEMIFVPGRNEWIKAHVGAAVGPSYLHSEGALGVQRLQDIGEAGETTAAPNDVEYGGFISEGDGGTFTITGLPPGDLYASPLRSEVIPGETPRILVTYGRNDSGGSSSTRIMRSDDGGFTWATGNFANASQLGALCLRWSGENVVAAFEDGTIEYSTDRGQTFNDASSPTGQPLRVPISNGEGTVVLVAHGSGVYSTDHGVTWTASSFPIAFTVRGGAYFEGVWYIFTADNEVLTSLDGVTWTLKGTLDLRCPGWEDVRLLDTQRGLFVCADHIVGLFVDDDTEDYYKKDFFWTRDGVTWTRSWSFGEGPAVIGPQQDSPTNQFPWRVRVHCSSAQSPAHLEPPWHQIMVVPATGDVGQGGFADVYIGPRDYGGVAAQVEHAEVAAAQTAPVPVGGVAAIGIDNSEYALPDHRHDTGTKGADVATSTSINLDTATGDYVVLTGDLEVEEIVLASGRSRTVRTGGSPMFEHGADLQLGGHDIQTQPGDFLKFRGDDDGVVYLEHWSRPSSPLRDMAWRFTHRGSVSTEGPDATESKENEGYFKVSGETIDQGNQALAIMALMARGGYVRVEREGLQTDVMQLRVGPAVNRFDHIALPILQRWSTTYPLDLSKLTQIGTPLALPALNRQGGSLSRDGHHMLTGAISPAQIEHWYLPDAGVSETAYLVHTIDASSISPASLFPVWGHDETYILVGEEGEVHQYDCDGQFGTVGGSFGDSLSITNSRNITLSADGAHLLVRLSTIVVSHWEGTPGDIASFTETGGDTLDLAAACSGSTTPTRIWLSPDGLLLLVASATSTTDLYLHKLELSAYATVGGATELQVSANLAALEGAQRGVWASNDLQFVYLTGNGNKTVIRWHTHTFTADVVYRVAFLPDDFASCRDYPLVFEDDATYGHYMEALVDVSWLPDDCIVAARFAASVGVSEGDTDDIGTTGDYGDLALFGFFTFTKNGGALVRVSHIGFWHPAYTDSPGTGGEQFIDVGYNEMTTPDLTIESGKLRAAVSIDGTGVYAGLALVGTMRVFFDSVTVRGELPAP